jgi:uncharacterized membrane protein (DUF373 family)
MTTPLAPKGPIYRVIRRFEHAIVLALIALMMLIIVVSTLDLAWLVLKDLATPPIFLLGIDELFDILGLVLIVLIAIELLETMKIYLQSHLIRVDIVLEVALIAIARKVIILDIKDYGAASVCSIAALVLTLAVADYLEHRARVASRTAQPPPAEGGTPLDDR